MIPRPARWVLLLLALVVRLEALQAPAVDTTHDGLALSRLPPVLADPEVRKQLGTGLTTSFVFTATARGGPAGKTKGAARVDVRYDLWDEIYIVTRIDGSGRAARVTLPSFERGGDLGLQSEAEPGARDLAVEEPEHRGGGEQHAAEGDGGGAQIHFFLP